VLLLVVLGLALAARLWVLVSLHFDGLYGQDAFAYYYHGVALWRDHTLTYPWPWLPRPLPLFFPLGESALLAGAFALRGQATVTAALAISVICGVATVGLVYGLALRVADRLYGPALASVTAVLAAAPSALAGLLVQASATIMSDAPALFWATAALWLWTLTEPSEPHRTHGSHPLLGRRLQDPITGPSPRRGHALPRPPPSLPAFAAGICYALAVSTRWEYALLALPMGAYLPAVPQLSRRLLPAILGALLAGMPQLLYSLQYSDPVLHHQWLTGWNPVHLWQARFVTVDGIQHYRMSVGAFYLLRPLLSPQSLPLPLAPFLPLGIAALAGRRLPACPWRGRDQTTHGAADAVSTSHASPRFGVLPDSQPSPRRGFSGPSGHTGPVLALLLSWWLAPALYLAGVPFESDRFTLIYLPPLAILEAIGFVTTVATLAGWIARYRRHVVLLAGLWAVCGLGLLAAQARGGIEVLAQGKEGDLAAVGWLRGHALPGAPIATFGLTLMLYHYGDPAAHHWTLLDLSAATSSDLARASRDPALIVVVNEGNLAAQWRGLPPQRAFVWLQVHAHLRPQAHVGGYTIFRRL